MIGAQEVERSFLVHQCGFCRKDKADSSGMALTHCEWRNEWLEQVEEKTAEEVDWERFLGKGRVPIERETQKCCSLVGPGV